ncbi:hypothetical protein CsSME_00008007 [Camellia sinensis var. sinensis]
MSCAEYRGMCKIRVMWEFVKAWAIKLFLLSSFNGATYSLLCLFEGVHLHVVGVCDSKALLVASDVLTTKLDDTSLTEVCQVKLKGSSLLTLGNSGQCKVFSNPEAMGKIIDVTTLLGGFTGLAFIDCSASSEPIGVLNRMVDLGCCVVMANKKPLTSSMEDYDKLLAYPRRIRHESTVGAGLPVIASLNCIFSSGDPVHHIIGGLGGTLGYVMSKVEDGKPFSQVVKSAKSLGYTEPGLIIYDFLICYRKVSDFRPLYK